MVIHSRRDRSASREEYVPGRGDLVWINFNPQVGREQAGRRPALVLSPEFYNRRAELALFCPITSRIKGYPFEVLLPPDLPVHGAVLADQVKSLDWRQRQVEFICSLSGPPLHQALLKASRLLQE